VHGLSFGGVSTYGGKVIEFQSFSMNKKITFTYILLVATTHGHTISISINLIYFSFFNKWTILIEYSINFLSKPTVRTALRWGHSRSTVKGTHD